MSLFPRSASLAWFRCACRASHDAVMGGHLSVTAAVPIKDFMQSRPDCRYPAESQDSPSAGLCRFYYARGMNVDEAYVFVCYDSRAGRARFTPHTGAHQDTSQKGGSEPLSSMITCVSCEGILPSELKLWRPGLRYCPHDPLHAMLSPCYTGRGCASLHSVRQCRLCCRP